MQEVVLFVLFGSIFLLFGCTDAFEEHKFKLSAQIYFLLSGTSEKYGQVNI